jgi:hypothetical protein
LTHCEVGCKALFLVYFIFLITIIFWSPEV